MAATTSQWWRRLVNPYEVKAGMVYLQGKSCMCDPYLSDSGVRFSRWGAAIKIFVPSTLHLRLLQAALNKLLTYLCHRLLKVIARAYCAHADAFSASCLQRNRKLVIVC